MFYNGSDVMKLIAVAVKSLSADDVRKKIVGEMYSNFTENSNIRWDKEELDDCIKNASVQKLGTLETKDPILKDIEDFSFLLLQK